MTFLLAHPDGGLVDVDAVWPYMMDVLAETTPEGLAIATGMTMGLRLALDEPELGRAALAAIQRRAGGPAEIPERLVQTLVDELLDYARRG